MIDPGALAAEIGPPARAGHDFGLGWVWLPPQAWLPTARALAARHGYDFFDWLTGYDEAPGIAVVAHLYSVGDGQRLLLRTLLSADPPVLASVTGVWRGADWHERETAEMFGVIFEGHPDPRPLLLPDGLAGHPLRKDFGLAARERPWPGAADPDPRRRGPRPFGPAAR